MEKEYPTSRFGTPSSGSGPRSSHEVGPFAEEGRHPGDVGELVDGPGGAEGGVPEVSRLGLVRAHVGVGRGQVAVAGESPQLTASTVLATSKCSGQRVR